MLPKGTPGARVPAFIRRSWVGFRLGSTPDSKAPLSEVDRPALDDLSSRAADYGKSTLGIEYVAAEGDPYDSLSRQPIHYIHCGTDTAIVWGLEEGSGALGERNP